MMRKLLPALSIVAAILALAIPTHAQCPGHSYATSFPVTENPISQGSCWINGGATGIGWGNVQTSSGQAHGTVISGAPPFNDSTAVLAGAWGPNQDAKATVVVTNGADSATQQEIELRTNTTATANSITGYEFDANIRNGQAYVLIVRWNGPRDNFTFCVNGGTCTGVQSENNFAVHTGDIVEANTVGSLHRLLVNGVVQFSTTDGTYTGGSPGIGFWQLGGTIGNLLDFGLTNFSATDSSVAATCNQSDVNAVINGPIHTAVDGDTITVPAGSCTWTAGITIPANIGITIQGSGTPTSAPGTMGSSASCASTTTIRGPNGGANLFVMSPTFGNSLSRLSCMNLIPPASGTWGIPLSITGTCASGGCPNLRLDNLTMPERWNSGGQTGATGGAINNMFGVADHNTIGDALNGTNGVISFPFLNIGFGAWKGLGQWGDQSWTSPDTFGTNQAFYFENNNFTNVNPTDTEVFSTNAGGARIVCRFNTFNSMTQSGTCSAHGTDTGGRLRSLRHWEGYYNTGNCTGTNGGQCNSSWPTRGGTGISFANTFVNAGASVKSLGSLGAQRRWRDGTVFGDCDGSSPWDSNDTPDGSGIGTNFFSGTIGTATKQTVANQLGYVLADSGSPGWSVNQWVSYPNPYSYHDVTNGHTGSDIQGGPSSANSFFADTVDYGSGFNPLPGQSYQIKRALVCLDQGGRGAGLLLKDTVPGNGVPVLVATNLPGPVNEAIDPVYEGADVMPVDAAGTISGPIENVDFYSEVVNQPAQTSPTSPFTGAVIAQPVTGYTCSNPSASCTYNVASTTGFVVNGFASATGTLPGLNGSWWSSAAKGKVTAIVVNTSITIAAPGAATISGGAGGVINTIGSGHGTLANRPTTCGPSVGYFAMDQGNWNQSGVGGQGVLYTCTAPNTWTLSYTPFCYPHLLTTGGVSACGAGTPQITFTPTSMAFGSVLVGSTSPVTPITVRNPGTAILNMSGVTLTGANPTDFAIVNNCGNSVQPNGSCTVTVSCTPLSAASFSANISFADNVAGSPQTVALTCTGTAPTAGISFAPSSVAFAAQTLGTSSAPTLVTVNSTGAGNLVISLVSVVGGNSTSFTQTNNCGTVVPAGTCAINVTFSPKAAGALASTVCATDNAPGSPQCFTVTGTGLGVPGIGFNPTSLPFGNQTVGSPSAVLTTTVSNPGTATVTLSSITLTGANAADYSIFVNSCGGTLAIGATCTVSVKLNPSVTGLRVANLTFTDNAAGSPQQVALSGTGTQAGTGFAPTTLAFGSQAISVPTSPMTTVLTNTGTSTLNIASILSTGPNAADFAVSSTTCGTTLGTGLTCNVSVVFTPSLASAETANLSFTDNAPGSPQAVPLTGTGIATLTIVLAPSSLTFPATVVNQSSPTQAITVTNPNDVSSITFASIAVTGGNTGDFSQTNTCGTTLAAKGICTVTVTFKPTATGVRASAVVFTDNVPNSPQSIALGGTGTQSGAQVAPISIAFPNTAVGATAAAQNITLTNTGTATLNIASVLVGGTNASYFTLPANSCGATLAPNVSCVVSVGFAPQTAIQASGTLTFTDDGPGSPQVVTLGGLGTTVALSFVPTSLTFPNTAIGLPSGTQGFKITNTGNGTTTITGITLTGANPSDFSQTNNCGGSLAGGANCTVTVTFTPVANGSRVANVSVASNAPGSPALVSLQGTGFTPTPAIGLSPGFIMFGNIVVGGSTSQAILVTNTGTAALTFTGFTLGGTNPGDFARGTTCGATLAPQATCLITVTFMPQATGARGATLSVADSVPGSPQIVPLSGTGLSITIAPGKGMWVWRSLTDGLNRGLRTLSGTASKRS